MHSLSHLLLTDPSSHTPAPPPALTVPAVPTETIDCRYCGTTMTREELFDNKHYVACKKAYEQAKNVSEATKCAGCGQFFARELFLSHLKEHGNEDCWKKWAVKGASQAAKEGTQAVKQESKMVAVGTRTVKKERQAVEEKTKAVKEGFQKPWAFDAEEVHQKGLLPPVLQKPRKERFEATDEGIHSPVDLSFLDE